MNWRHRSSNALKHAVMALQSEWGFHSSYGLRDILERYATFVREVEDGYERSLDEYLVELELRESLEEMTIVLQEAERAWMRSKLAPWDERLRFSTREAAGSLLTGRDDVQHFWWFRIPLQLCPRMASDLREEGLLASAPRAE